MNGVITSQFWGKRLLLMNRLTLGTVQFGLAYGINNIHGKPDLNESLNMLKYAYDEGITNFDTAYAYGNAEIVLGKFIQKYQLESKITVTTKLKPNILDESNNICTKLIEKQIIESLTHLNLKSADGYLLHSPKHVFNPEIVKEMKLIKEKGLCRNIGVSIYEEDEALYAVRLNQIDYIQIPYSVFDQRLDSTDFFKLARDNGKKIFARSAFLQGLVFMHEDRIPHHLIEFRNHLIKFKQIINKYNYTVTEACILFSLSNANINSVVVGVDKIEHLNDLITIFKKNLHEFEDCKNEIKESFININKYLISPSLWKKD